MRNNSADKVKQIINEEFDSRMAGAIVNYIISAGWENVKEMTEENIKQVKSETNIMTDEFAQTLVRIAVKITNECDLFDDFIPYIIMENYNYHVPTKEINLNKEDFESDWTWNHILKQLDIYDEGTNYVVLKSYVKQTDAEEV